MSTPPEQGGALSEASRLLQEGLQLLDARGREVDRLIGEARERAEQLTAEAHERAHEITANAERQRVELEEQVAALRNEVAGLREELAQLRAGPTGGRGGRSAAVAAATGLVGGAAAARPGAVAADQAVPNGGEPQPATAGAEPIAAAQLEAADMAAASEAAGTPRWGRRSTIAAAQQAIRSTRSSRPRWLPPWLPFLIVLLAAAAIVATNVDGFGVVRTPSPDAGLPTTTSLGEPGLSIAAATIGSTSAPVAAGSLGFATLTETPTSQPSLLVAANAQPTSTSVPSPSRLPSPAAASPRPTITLPPPGARVGSPVALPAETAPQGPIVAAYTTYATYTVQPGDTLNQVASQFGVSGATIMRASGLVDPNLLVPGQVLTIPRDTGWLYRVQPGDTLDVVALRFGLSVEDLAAASGLSALAIRPGDLLFVPNRGTPAPKQVTIRTNG